MGDIAKLDDRDFVDTLTPAAYNAAFRAKRTYEEYFGEYYLGPRQSYWVTGKPGVGKSWYVKSFFPYIKPISKWWDTYMG